MDAKSDSDSFPESFRNFPLSGTSKPSPGNISFPDYIPRGKRGMSENFQEQLAASRIDNTRCELYRFYSKRSRDPIPNAPRHAGEWCWKFLPVRSRSLQDRINEYYITRPIREFWRDIESPPPWPYVIRGYNREQASPKYGLNGRVHPELHEDPQMRHWFYFNREQFGMSGPEWNLDTNNWWTRFRQHIGIGVEEPFDTDLVPEAISVLELNVERSDSEHEQAEAPSEVWSSNFQWF